MVAQPDADGIVDVVDLLDRLGIVYSTSAVVFQRLIIISTRGRPERREERWRGHDEADADGQAVPDPVPAREPCVVRSDPEAAEPHRPLPR